MTSVTKEVPLTPKERETLARLCGFTVTLHGSFERADGREIQPDAFEDLIPASMLRILIRYLEEKR